jgi:class 3 adenylate cyclase
MSELPTGTVTFLFTDIEGSTELLEEIGDEACEEALLEHRRYSRQRARLATTHHSPRDRSRVLPGVGCCSQTDP